MAFENPRVGIHTITVQGLPPTTPRPRKKFGHTVKAVPSAPIAGNFAPIVRRAPVAVVIKRRHKRH